MNKKEGASWITTHPHKEIFELSQLEENKPIYIVMNKKEGASWITTHPQQHKHKIKHDKTILRTNLP